MVLTSAEQLIDKSVIRIRIIQSGLGFNPFYPDFGFNPF